MKCIREIPDNGRERTRIMHKRKGFTLIELLVVIAIIALLMAILMPALQRVKRQARTIVCRKNLSQYGLASRMYLDDFDGNFIGLAFQLGEKVCVRPNF